MNKLNKILIITSEFPPEPGGIGNHAYNLSKYLEINKYSVTVLTPERVSEDKLFDENQLFLIYRTPKKGFFKFFVRFGKSINLARKNDIIITSGKFSLWVGGFLSFFFKKKIIAVIHGTEVNFKNFFLKKSIDVSLKKHSLVIAVSNFTKSLISDLKLKKSKVIFNGFEPLGFRKEEIRDINTFPNLITVGSVTDRKGQINIIKALPTLVKEYPKIHYHIVGTPIEKDYLFEIAKKLKVDSNITFYGKVTNRIKNSLLNRSDVFVMLSNTTQQGDIEGFGIAILEANYLGVPAIGSINCGIEDAIKNNYSGFLINPKNQIAIRDSLKMILKNKLEFSENSKKWSKNFIWSKVIEQYIKEIDL